MGRGKRELWAVLIRLKPGLHVLNAFLYDGIYRYPIFPSRAEARKWKAKLSGRNTSLRIARCTVGYPR